MELNRCEIKKRGNSDVKLLRKVKSRFGGELYTKLRYLKIYKKLISKESILENKLLDISRPAKIRFILGNKYAYKHYYKYYINLYKAIKEKYTSRKDVELLDIKGIILKKPFSEQDQWEFAINFNNILIYFVYEDSMFCDAITNEGSYEYGNVQIQKDDVLIDCGANMGMFTALASKKGAEVYAIEPTDYLNDNYLDVIANENQRISTYKYALINTNEVQKFKINSNNMSANTLKQTGLCRELTEEIDVQGITLDTFVKKHNLPRVDFIKADIEGAERYMLMGARQVLKEFAPKLSICTYHLPDDPKVLRELILDANPNYIIEEKYKKMVSVK